MKTFWIVLVILFALICPALTQAEVSSSASASGNASAAAAASDGQTESTAVSGEGASASASIDSQNSTSTVVDAPRQESGRARPLAAKQVASTTATPSSQSKTGSSTCNISTDQLQKFTGEFEKISPITDRTVKILKLMALAITGIGLVIILQIVILLKSRKTFVISARDN